MRERENKVVQCFALNVLQNSYKISLPYSYLFWWYVQFGWRTGTSQEPVEKVEFLSVGRRHAIHLYATLRLGVRRRCRRRLDGAQPMIVHAAYGFDVTIGGGDDARIALDRFVALLDALPVVGAVLALVEREDLVVQLDHRVAANALHVADAIVCGRWRRSRSHLRLDRWRMLRLTIVVVLVCEYRRREEENTAGGFARVGGPLFAMVVVVVVGCCWGGNNNRAGPEN